MKALSCRQPWAELVIDDQKPVENRTWWTSYRGPLIWHASMTIDFDAGEWLNEQGILVRNPITRGAILGVVQLVDCVRIEKMRNPSRYAFGPWCWILAKPQRLAKPIPYMGKLGLFDITEPWVLEQLPQ